MLRPARCGRILHESAVAWHRRIGVSFGLVFERFRRRFPRVCLHCLSATNVTLVGETLQEERPDGRRKQRYRRILTTPHPHSSGSHMSCPARRVSICWVYSCCRVYSCMFLSVILSLEQSFPCRVSCSLRFSNRSRGSAHLCRCRSVADAATGREVGDWWGQRLMLRGNREQPRPRCGWSKIDMLERPDRYESRRKRPFLLESSGSFGYDRGLRSDKWAIPVEGVRKEETSGTFLDRRRYGVCRTLL